MSVFKTIGAKLADGFLYGAGFMLAMVVVTAVYYTYMEMNAQATLEANRVEYSEERKRMFRDYDETALLELSISREIITQEEFTLLGTVENNGDAGWSSVSIKAELFNEAGEFIDECSEYISETSRPGDIINFKLSCGSCSKLQLHDYKSYKISIVNAHYAR